MAGDHGNQFSLWRSGANGKNAQAFAGRFTGFLHRIFIVILAIGKKHQHLVAFLILFTKGLDGRLNRLADLGSAFGDEIHRNQIYMLAQRLLIDCERALEKRRAGEGNQAKAIALAQFEQFVNGQLRAFHAVGREILREHAARGIHRDEYIQRIGLGFFQDVPPAWRSE